MYIAVGYFNSFPSTKILLKTCKLPANPSACYRLKTSHAGTSDETFRKVKYELKRFLLILCLLLQLPSLSRRNWQTYIGRTCHHPLKQNEKHTHRCGIFWENESQLVVYLPRIVSQFCDKLLNWQHVTLQQAEETCKSIFLIQIDWPYEWNQICIIFSCTFEARDIIISFPLFCQNFPQTYCNIFTISKTPLDFTAAGKC